MGIEDDLGFAEPACSVLRKPEQDAAVPLPLEIAPDTHQAGLLGLAQ
ncbi:MAG TPA: hypothetical protein VFI58_00395 [Xanthobacteraceae bacterium]|jgi:hypothetical protein|nr:hypothetical protein [Xanthobacteraceae bacterium]